MTQELKTHECWVYDYGCRADMVSKSEVDAAIAELNAENERLKDELDAANNQCENLINSATDIMLRQDKANDAKCDEVESLKATHYAEMVDAGMRERRLKRALWLARAERALEKITWFKLWNASISTMNPEDGARQEYDKWKKNLGKFLKKAEEYK